MRATFLDEGGRTLGLWLPLALADLKAAILAPWIEKEKRGLLARSATLAGWCLPMLARAAEADEKESEALQMYESVRALAAKEEAKKKNRGTE